MAPLCCGRLGDTDQQGVLQVRERFSELERSYSKPKSKNTEFMMEVESVSALQFCHVRVCQSAPTPLSSALQSGGAVSQLCASLCVGTKCVCASLPLSVCTLARPAVPPCAGCPPSPPLPSPQLCRDLRAGRLTSCKSAKDRTGMAVTLEEASILSRHHQLDPDSLVAVLNALRR